MENAKYQTKLVVSSVGFVLLIVVVFLFVFPLQKGKIDGNLTELLESKKVVLELRQEQRNTEIAAEDLREMGRNKIQPEEFFSRDTTLVREISYLEDLSSRLGLDMTLTVSGLASKGIKVQDTKNLVAIPFSLRVGGQYVDLAKFLEHLENAKYLVSVRSVSLSAGPDSSTSANLSGVFYLKP